MNNNLVEKSLCFIIAIIIISVYVCECVTKPSLSTHDSQHKSSSIPVIASKPVPLNGDEKHAKDLDKDCDNLHITDTIGTIKSPNYPQNYSNHISCMWTISGSHSDSIITISFDDLDLEIPKESQQLCPELSNEDTITSEQLCCPYNWIKISSTNGSERRYCGHSEDRRLTLRPFISSSNRVSIKFHATRNIKGGRGFHLSYMISASKSQKCKSDEFHCGNGKCVLSKWRCNRRDECGDASDEQQCDDICLGPNEVKCSTVGHTRVAGCYSFSKQRCDSVWNCENGVDEKGCGGCPPDMFVCAYGKSCYSESKRCDGIPDCVDFTDELNCGVCGPNKTQCGLTSLTPCYDPHTQRCNRILDCPNGIDETNCVHGCFNKILCASGSGCYSLDERCNGVPECNDYSDEKNCTLDLCRVERGSFLCGNGRCIRAIWTCDRSNDCADGTDEINCLKNSVITAAIMGSLICGLLLVIAISCTCKLIALRQVERHHSNSHSSSSHISHYYDRHLNINSLNGELDTPLFRLEHGFLFREPPPSYATAVGGYQTDRNNSHIEQIRQIRRQRRMRRNRRRPPTPPPLEFVEGANIDNSNSSSPANNSEVSTSSVTNINNINQSESINKIEHNSNIKEETNSSHGTNSQPLNSSSLASDVHIELESIPTLSHSDCDSQPLIS